MLARRPLAVHVTRLPDVPVVVLAYSDGRVTVKRAADGRDLHTYETSSSIQDIACADLQGAPTAFILQDQKISALHLANGEVMEVAEREGPASSGRLIARTHSGRTVLAYGDGEGKVSILSRGERDGRWTTRTVQGHDSGIVSMAFSRMGRHEIVVSCAEDATCFATGVTKARVRERWTVRWSTTRTRSGEKTRGVWMHAPVVLPDVLKLPDDLADRFGSDPNRLASVLSRRGQLRQARARTFQGFLAETLDGVPLVILYGEHESGSMITVRNLWRPQSSEQILDLIALRVAGKPVALLPRGSHAIMACTVQTMIHVYRFDLTRFRFATRFLAGVTAALAGGAQLPRVSPKMVKAIALRHVLTIDLHSDIIDATFTPDGELVLLAEEGIVSLDLRIPEFAGPRHPRRSAHG